MKPSTRALYLLLFLSCAGLLLVAVYLQLVQGLQACPLCIAQRLAYWLIGLLALLAFLQRPGRLGRRIYAVLLAGFALAGGAVAAHQVWVVRHPAAFECAISLEEKILNRLPLADGWPMMFAPMGACTDPTPVFFGLYLPDWSLLCFVALLAAALYTGFAPDRAR